MKSSLLVVIAIFTLLHSQVFADEFNGQLDKDTLKNVFKSFTNPSKAYDYLIIKHVATGGFVQFSLSNGVPWYNFPVERKYLENTSNDLLFKYEDRNTEPLLDKKYIHDKWLYFDKKDLLKIILKKYGLATNIDYLVARNSDGTIIGWQSEYSNPLTMENRAVFIQEIFTNILSLKQPINVTYELDTFN